MAERGLFLGVRVRKAQEIMRRNLHRRLPLGEIANSVNTSVWWLCHIFKSETGIPPTKGSNQLVLHFTFNRFFERIFSKVHNLNPLARLLLPSIAQRRDTYGVHLKKKQKMGKRKTTGAQ